MKSEVEAESTPPVSESAEPPSRETPPSIPQNTEAAEEAELSPPAVQETAASNSEIVTSILQNKEAIDEANEMEEYLDNADGPGTEYRVKKSV